MRPHAGIWKSISHSPRLEAALLRLVDPATRGHPQCALRWTCKSTSRLPLQFCHFPPGTSKWNKIEHRLFCFISKNWRGRPLTSYKTVVNLIASTTTKTGLRVQAAIDDNLYQTGIAVSDEQLSRVRITPASFYGEWNYAICPND